MKLNIKVLMSFSLAAISAWVIISALKWPLRSALFPLVIGSIVLIMCVLDLLLNFFGRPQGGKEVAVMDFVLTKDVDPKLAARRTISVFLWIFGFFFLILLFGFPTSIPLFFILFLKLSAREKWWTSLAVTASVWGSFYALFVWLLNVRFMEGWAWQWLGR